MRRRMRQPAAWLSNILFLRQHPTTTRLNLQLREGGDIRIWRFSYSDLRWSPPIPENPSETAKLYNFLFLNSNHHRFFLKLWFRILQNDCLRLRCLIVPKPCLLASLSICFPETRSSPTRHGRFGLIDQNLSQGRTKYCQK